MSTDTTVIWIDRQVEEAPEGVAVRVLTESGMETTLVRQGNLWFLPDMSMYVYYTPIRWHRLDG